MRPAVVILDAQEDFLARRGLAPARETLIASAGRLLAAARAGGIPVVHVHTVVEPDGSGRMPHWKARGVMACVRGSAGVLAPPPLRPIAGEPVIEKRFFSAFGAPRMAAVLAELDLDTLLVAGVYLHGCVRATALDAYERGYAVVIADDAVASDDPAHAEITRDYLAERAASFLDVEEIVARYLDRTGGADGARTASGAARSTARRMFLHRNPARLGEVLHAVPIGSADDVAAAVATAARARRALAARAIGDRGVLLERWADAIEARRDEFAACMATEIGKPLTDAHEEIGRALAHVRTAVRLFAGSDVERLAPAAAVRHRPHGVVALVTPFNNPLAIPAGKIAPALVFGNAVVLKPAGEAAATTRLLLATLAAAGVPDGVVTVVHGDARTARALVRHPGVDAVSLTGSNATGRAMHALCARDGTPFQAELGGNNAAIVLRDCDVEAEAAALARAAFGFAGQRCTAIRRIVVEGAIAAAFTDALAGAVAALPMGEPRDPATVVGPLVGSARRARVLAALAGATAAGAEIIRGGDIPEDLAHGAWLAPILLRGVGAEASVFREETFGPLALVVPADDLTHALALANAVPHGLVAYLASDDDGARRRFAAEAEAGIVRVARDAPFLHPEAPFGGWKASGVGPPEHGRWDRAFYARPQALYGRVDTE